MLALFFASSLEAGDCYLLQGDVGAGKSFFSRTFIRAASNDEDATVPSPTYLLQNTYATSPPVHHFDLYRLESSEKDLERLNLGGSFSEAVSLIEWPERLTDRLMPRQFVRMKISHPSAAEHQSLRSLALTRFRNSNQLERPSWEEESDHQQETLEFVSSDDNGDKSKDEDNGSEEVSDGGLTTSECRVLEFSVRGSRWKRRIEELKGHIETRGAALGMFLFPE